MRRISILGLLLAIGVASAVLVGYVSNTITFQATVTTPPIKIEVLGNELENATEVIGGNTYSINVSTVNLANNPIYGLRTEIVCSANPAFESAKELKIEAYFFDENAKTRDPQTGTYPLEKAFDPQSKNITFYIPSSTGTWNATVGYNTTGYFFVTTAPDIKPNTTITCKAIVKIID